MERNITGISQLNPHGIHRYKKQGDTAVTCRMNVHGPDVLSSRVDSGRAAHLRACRNGSTWRNGSKPNCTEFGILRNRNLRSPHRLASPISIRLSPLLHPPTLLGRSSLPGGPDGSVRRSLEVQLLLDRSQVLPVLQTLRADLRRRPAVDEVFRRRKTSTAG